MCFGQVAEQPLAEEDQVRATLHRAPACGEVLPQGGRVVHEQKKNLTRSVAQLLSCSCCASSSVTKSSVYAMGTYLPGAGTAVCFFVSSVFHVPAFRAGLLYCGGAYS